MSDLLKSIDARTKLAGANKLEILLFSLGTDQRTGRKETFGINVFKVREVMRTPEITSAPEMSSAVEGMVSLRGQLVPVIDLAKYTGIITDKKPEIMIVTEYNGHTQGFLVEAVDTILRLDWSAMRVPPEMISNRMGGLVTAVTELQDNTRLMMIDVERVHASYEALVADPEVDIVYVASPHTSHREHALLAIAAGKHFAQSQTFRQQAIGFIAPVIEITRDNQRGICLGNFLQIDGQRIHLPTPRTGKQGKMHANTMHRDGA